MWNPSNPCMHGQRTLNDNDDDDDDLRIMSKAVLLGWPTHGSISIFSIFTFMTLK